MSTAPIFKIWKNFIWKFFSLIAGVLDAGDKNLFANISANFVKIQNCLIGLLRGPRETDSWKKSKICVRLPLSCRSMRSICLANMSTSFTLSAHVNTIILTSKLNVITLILFGHPQYLILFYLWDSVSFLIKVDYFQSWYSILREWRGYIRITIPLFILLSYHRGYEQYLDHP